MRLRLLVVLFVLFVAIPAAADLRTDAAVRLRTDAAGFVLQAVGPLADPRPGSSVEVARAFLRAERSALGISDPDRDLTLARVRAWRGRSFVRFGRVVAGLPVLRNEVVVVVDSDGGVTQANVVHSRLDRVRSAVQTSWQDALRIAEESAPDEISADPTVALALLVEGRTARAVWVVDFDTETGEWRLNVDAATGRPIRLEDRRRYALGRVYDPNSVIAPDLVDVDLPNLEEASQLTGAFADAYNCETRAGEDCRAAHIAVPDVDGNYLYDPALGDVDEEFPEVMAYFHTDRINRYFEDTHGYQYDCRGTRRMRATVNVHRGIDTAISNAWYGDSNGDECGDISFGQGEDVDFAYDADVIYHEFTHDVVNTIVGGLWMDFDSLGVDPTPGAFSEGTADYFAVSVTGDQRLGDYALGEGGAGETIARTADNDLSCPEDIFGEGHYDGRIWVGAMWEVRESIGASKADAVVYGALQRMTDEEDFAAAALDVRAAADDLALDGVLVEADVDAISGILDARGMTGCERIVPLEDGVNVTALVLGTDALGGGWFDVPFSTGPVQYVFDAPADVSFFGFDITHLLAGAGRDYVVHMRRTDPVDVDWGADRITSDHVFADDPGDVTMSLWSDPAVVGGERYYFLFENRDADEIVVSVRTTVGTIYIPDSGPFDEDAGTDAGPPAKDAGADADAGVDADAGPADAGAAPPRKREYGCGCRAGGAEGSSLLWFALLAWVATRRITRS